MKWAFALIGYFIFRFPGAIIGFLIGSVFENTSVKTYTQTSFGRQTVSPSDFELNLLSLCAIIIKADGEVSQRELDYVRQYFVQAYGKDRANATFRTFNEVVKNREVSAENICRFLAMRTRYEVRLQLIHFLFGIAQADGAVSTAEEQQLKLIASFLSLSHNDYESIKAMFFKNADHAYTILEIDKNASNEEVKKAYRNMAKKYHPDKVNTADEAIKKGAEEKFKQVQIAYEQIQKERSMN